MKKDYIAPKIQIVELAENDILAFSNTGVLNGKFKVLDWDTLTN